MELVVAEFGYYHYEDPDDDGTPNLQHWVVVQYTGEDVDQDGTMDNEDLIIWVHKETSP